MRRLFRTSLASSLRFWAAAFAACAAALACAAACGSGVADVDNSSTDASQIRRDGSTVDPLDGGDAASDTGAPGPTPSCAKYCELVQSHCDGGLAQYVSKEQCLAFCAHIPPEPLKQDAPSLSCRQYYAGNPALTDPAAYCLPAGPFGGGVCGDRCTAFCQVTLSACPPGGGSAPYESYPDCATACARFSFRDAGSDGGGESPYGPETGDTLNCRLYWLRKAVVEPSACADLAPDGGPCR